VARRAGGRGVAHFEHHRQGFPAPDGYITAIAAIHGFAVASRATSAFDAAGLTVIDPRAGVPTQLNPAQSPGVIDSQPPDLRRPPKVMTIQYAMFDFQYFP
jgi:hypothetical protein